MLRGTSAGNLIMGTDLALPTSSHPPLPSMLTNGNKTSFTFATVTQNGCHNIKSQLDHQMSTVCLLWQTDAKLSNAPHLQVCSVQLSTPLYFRPMFKQINRSS